MMDWAETLLNGFLLGIASLPLCTTCYLLFVPVLVVSSSGTVFSHLKFFSLFAVGRLTGYIAVGAAAGFLAPTVPFVAQKEFFGLVQLVLAVALLVWAIRHLRRELATCKEPSKNPFLFGLLSGLSLCPPFLAGVLLALYYGAVLKGIALFLGFFAGAVIPLFCLTLCGLATKLNSVRRIGLVFAIFAAFSLAAHGVKLLTYIPPQTSSDIEKERVFKSLLPEAESFSGSLSPKDAPPYYAAYDSEGNPIAIIFFTEEVSPEVEGYAGKIPACVACDLELRVKAVRFLPNKETPELVDEMFEEKFARQFVGKTPSDRFEAGVDVKGISGATVTTDAICRSIKLSLERIASAYSSTPFPKTSRPFLSWYSLLRSGVVVLFFCGAILFCISRLQRLRLILLALSVAVLGFCFKGLFLSTRSVTTLFVDGRVSQSPELWVLAGGALVTSLLWGRLYCGYVCPFGGLSELLFRILPIKLKISPKVIGFLRWVKYGIFVSLILLLAAGSSLYFAEKLEPFAPIFIGAPATSLILALITLLLSASFYRFYCRFLCPIGAVMELLSSARILSPNTPITCDSCGLCRKECPSEALHFKGKKLYQEAAFCFNCVDCDVVRRRKGCVQSR